MRIFRNVALAAFGLMLIAHQCSAVDWTGDWAFACDFEDHDLSNVLTSAEQCSQTCLGKRGCTHYTWTAYNGGTCWMKSGKVTKEDALDTFDSAMICGVVKVIHGSTGMNGGGSGNSGNSGNSDVSPSPNNFRITTVNKCSQEIYVGAFDQNGKHPNGGGWLLSAGESSFVDLQPDFIGRFWGRTGCRTINGVFKCDTGDCGPKVKCAGATGAPPATLAEFTISGAGGQTFYDMSLLDGTNLPMTITPVSSTFNGGDCQEISCPKDLNEICPNDFKKWIGGKVVGCRSACEKLGSPMYCCAGEYNCSPHVPSCPPGRKPCNPETWPFNHAKFFKDNCERGYSYAYDDISSTFTCKGSPKTNFVITFCP